MHHLPRAPPRARRRRVHHPQRRAAAGRTRPGCPPRPRPRRQAARQRLLRVSSPHARAPDPAPPTWRTRTRRSTCRASATSILENLCTRSRPSPPSRSTTCPPDAIDAGRHAGSRRTRTRKGGRREARRAARRAHPRRASSPTRGDRDDKPSRHDGAEAEAGGASGNVPRRRRRRRRAKKTVAPTPPRSRRRTRRRTKGGNWETPPSLRRPKRGRRRRHRGSRARARRGRRDGRRRRRWGGLRPPTAVPRGPGHHGERPRRRAVRRGEAFSRRAARSRRGVFPRDFIRTRTSVTHTHDSAITHDTSHSPSLHASVVVRSFVRLETPRACLKEAGSPTRFFPAEAENENVAPNLYAKRSARLRHLAARQLGTSAPWLSCSDTSPRGTRARATGTMSAPAFEAAVRRVSASSVGRGLGAARRVGSAHRVAREPSSARVVPDGSRGARPPARRGGRALRGEVRREHGGREGHVRRALPARFCARGRARDRVRARVIALRPIDEGDLLLSVRGDTPCTCSRAATTTPTTCVWRSSC